MPASPRAATALLLGPILLALILTAGACSSSGNGGAKTFPVSAAPPSSSPTNSTPAPTNTGGFNGSGPAGSTSATSTSPSPGPTTRPVPTTPIRTVTARGQHQSYKIDVWAEKMDDSCFDHAYGTPVITYLTKHPCRGLTRILATTTVHGRTVGFAQSSFGFDGTAPQVYSTAGNFEALVAKDGTGNIEDLFREGYRLPAGPTRVPSPDAFKALGQDAGVSVVDAWYTAGSTPENDPALIAMAEDIFLQV